MDIMTADGIKNFFNPKTPQFQELHERMVKDLVELMNRKTIAGWNRKFPGEMVYEFELLNQVRLTHIPPCEHPTVYAELQNEIEQICKDAFSKK
jgi:hypothetical protein